MSETQVCQNAERGRRKFGWSLRAQRKMKNGTVSLDRRVLNCALALCLVVLPLPAASAEKDAANTADLVLETMQAELTRATGELLKADPPPYFLSYQVYEEDAAFVVGAYGSLMNSITAHRRRCSAKRGIASRRHRARPTSRSTTRADRGRPARSIVVSFPPGCPRGGLPGARWPCRDAAGGKHTGQLPAS